MRQGRRRAPKSLPLGALMAQVIVVVAVVLVFGVYQQQRENARKAEEFSSMQTQLNRLEAQLDQRRSALDGREETLEAGEAALVDGQKALETDQRRLADDQSALESGQEALSEGQQALDEARKALETAQADLETREQRLEAQQSNFDARLQDYEELQKAVDDALGARGRIAAALRAAFQTAGVSAAVDSEGGVTVGADALFEDAAAALAEEGEALMDRLLPAWYGVLQGESVSAISVEAYAPSGDSQAQDLAGRRARAILEYFGQTSALDEAARAAIAAEGLSGVRFGQGSRIVLRFYLNSNALRAARAG